VQQNSAIAVLCFSSFYLALTAHRRRRVLRRGSAGTGCWTRSRAREGACHFTVLSLALYSWGMAVGSPFSSSAPSPATFARRQNSSPTLHHCLFHLASSFAISLCAVWNRSRCPIPPESAGRSRLLRRRAAAPPRPPSRGQATSVSRWASCLVISVVMASCCPSTRPFWRYRAGHAQTPSPPPVRAVTVVLTVDSHVRTTSASTKQRSETWWAPWCSIRP